MSDTFSAFSRTAWLFSLCYFLLFPLLPSHRNNGSPLIFCLFDFPSASPLSFSCTRFSAHSLLVPRLLLWSPPSSPAHFHTPSVCQQRFSSRVFTAPISPQWANLPQSTQQYSAVTLCVGWKHTHTRTHSCSCFWRLSKLGMDWSIVAGTTTPSMCRAFHSDAAFWHVRVWHVNITLHESGWR